MKLRYFLHSTISLVVTMAILSSSAQAVISDRNAPTHNAVAASSDSQMTHLDPNTLMQARANFVVKRMKLLQSRMGFTLSDQENHLPEVTSKIE